MKLRRVAILVCLIGVVLLGLLWLRNVGRDFATPAECVHAFYDAGKNGQTANYLHCLAEPLRARTQESYGDAGELERYLQATMGDLKSWVQPAQPEIDGTTAYVDMEEQRVHSRKRIRFRLELVGGAWLIAAIGTDQEMPIIIPYGTHEKDLLPKS